MINGGNGIKRAANISSGRFIPKGNTEYLAKTIVHKSKIPMRKKSNIVLYSAGKKNNSPMTTGLVNNIACFVAIIIFLFKNDFGVSACNHT